MEARFCEKCGAVTERPRMIDGHYYCSRCAGEKEGVGPPEATVPLRDSAAPVEEKLKFRCVGCGALLSSKKVAQKSRLRCPQCQTELFLNPDGSVEPVFKVRTQQKSVPNESPPQTQFTKEELEKALDLQRSSERGSDETSVSEQREETSVPPPPPLPLQKQPRKPVPRVRVTRSAIMEKYRKMAESIGSGESKTLVGLAVVLLLLPAVFILIVALDVEGVGFLKQGFASLAETFDKAAKRLRGISSEDNQNSLKVIPQRRPKILKEEGDSKKPTGLKKGSLEGGMGD